MAHLADPRRVVDGVADVRPAADERVARVQAHADADRPARRPGLRSQRPLRVCRRLDCLARALERCEETVAEVLDLDPAVGRKCRAEQLVVAP